MNMPGHLGTVLTVSTACLLLLHGSDIPTSAASVMPAQLLRGTATVDMPASEICVASPHGSGLEQIVGTMTTCATIHGSGRSQFRTKTSDRLVPTEPATIDFNGEIRRVDPSTRRVTSERFTLTFIGGQSAGTGISGDGIEVRFLEGGLDGTGI